jgi:hypothetical protein
MILSVVPLYLSLHMRSTYIEYIIRYFVRFTQASLQKDSSQATFFTFIVKKWILPSRGYLVNPFLKTMFGKT